MKSANLWEEAQNGSDDAVAKLLDSYRSYLLAIANASLHSDVSRKVAPSDIVQEALISAHNGFSQFGGSNEDSLKGWLRRILKNQLIDSSRAFRNAEKREVSREVPMDELGNEKPACESNSPLIACVQNERSSRLLAQIDELPEPERQVVRLYHESGLTFTQIAEQISCSRESARRYWARALRHLARSIGDD
ncbi:MAG: sigma-70 family RNA polymerase sigma factor [Planctomycetales bacterium]|nr:sigma-70 family RNA polymerase sigma factor [Planctomycetales bacterium]